MGIFARFKSKSKKANKSNKKAMADTVIMTLASIAFAICLITYVKPEYINVIQYIITGAGLIMLALNVTSAFMIVNIANIINIQLGLNAENDLKLFIYVIYFLICTYGTYLWRK